MDVSGGAFGLLGLRRKRCWRSRDLRPRAGQQRITRSPLTQISACCWSNLSKNHHEIVVFLLHEAAHRHRSALIRLPRRSQAFVDWRAFSAALAALRHPKPEFLRNLLNRRKMCSVLTFVRNSDYPEEAEGNRARTSFGESVACWWRVDA